MEGVKVKFDWEHPITEENYGHTQSEWGNNFLQKNKSMMINSYKMKWEKF